MIVVSTILNNLVMNVSVPTYMPTPFLHFFLFLSYNFKIYSYFISEENKVKLFFMLHCPVPYMKRNGQDNQAGIQQQALLSVYPQLESLQPTDLG